MGCIIVVEDGRKRVKNGGREDWGDCGGVALIVYSNSREEALSLRGGTIAVLVILAGSGVDIVSEGADKRLIFMLRCC
jgi:hypothetical protein